MADALLRGLSAIFRPRLLLIYWSLSVLLALGVALAYQSVVAEATGQLPDVESLAAEPAAPFVDDFRSANGAALGVLGRGASSVTWAWMLVTTILAGGLVRAFEKRAAEDREREGRRWNLRVFLADSGQFAFRMVRLLFVTLVLAHAADWFFNGVLFDWHERHLVAVENERVTLWSDWLRQGLFLLTVFLVATWTDVARVQVVIERRSSVLGGLVSAANALISRPVEVFGLAGAWVGLELIAMMVFAHLLGGLRTDSYTQLGWWLLGSQVLILLRLGLGFARVASYTAIAEDLRTDSESRLGSARAA